MSDKLVTFNADTGEVKLSFSLVRKYLVSGDADRVTDEELVKFIQLCKFQKLNPYLREAYLIKYGNSPATIITGKDVFMKRAAKNVNFNGMSSGIYVLNKEGAVEKRSGSFSLPGEQIVGGWAAVHRKDWEHPMEASVSMGEYIGRKKDGSVNKQWSQMPATMITKVAKVQALREAFPEDFQGLYDSSEINSGAEELPQEPINVTPEKEPTPQLEDPIASEEGYNLSEAVETSLQEKAVALVNLCREKGIFSQEQHDLYVRQAQSLKSELGLNSMISNFERQLAKEQS